MTLSTLSNKKTFITGAASGIGRATAQAAARQGAQLLLTDINADALHAVADEITRAGGTVLMAEPFDIANRDAVQDFAARAQAQHGSLDVLMNIAGISIWGAPESLGNEHWQRCVDINLMGPIHVIEAFLPAMVAAGRGGHIVNVSSAAGLFGLPWHAAYSASKFGLRGVSEVLRFDLARHGIGVSLVCPGGVDTGLVKTLQIVGVDASAPRLARWRARFQAHAITPDKAAQAILRGIRRNQYLVFTSNDIRMGHWFQRYCPPLYAFAMQRANDLLSRIARTAARP
ncbi:SDR family oxidoreductase [Sinimarinibacterium sp. NLF-5-8]|uniref:SDR family oxidoreductase n=1 Tax=Sinimarinibacterium sp. NLF-5-8 TaxID=2698684 RepID=UPI00137BA223|nr:SDR family oxidoreductase [Sinimarinibacterium sp. NLF-5-8]QHS10791.1 SDR family oxidoreductase [Sinimarinibacterium sp. NLF-5-8]